MSCFVGHNTYRKQHLQKSKPDVTSTSATSVTTATIPYIKGSSETIPRILQPYNIRVTHKPITTLRQLLTNVKDKDEPSDRQGAVYKIKCCDCQDTYIGETGRNLNIRLTEYKRATKIGDINNDIAEHHLKNNPCKIPPWNSMKFHGIPWNFMEFPEIPWTSMEFYVIPWKLHAFPCELHGIL